jgi:hypothetical protein
MVGLGLALVVAAVALESRAGARRGLPRRRRPVRPVPAPQARARP